MEGGVRGRRRKHRRKHRRRRGRGVSLRMLLGVRERRRRRGEHAALRRVWRRPREKHRIPQKGRMLPQMPHRRVKGACASVVSLMPAIWTDLSPPLLFQGPKEEEE